MSLEPLDGAVRTIKHILLHSLELLKIHHLKNATSKTLTKRLLVVDHRNRVSVDLERFPMTLGNKLTPSVHLRGVRLRLGLRMNNGVGTRDQVRIEHQQYFLLANHAIPSLILRKKKLLHTLLICRMSQIPPIALQIHKMQPRRLVKAYILRRTPQLRVW